MNTLDLTVIDNELKVLRDQYKELGEEIVKLSKKRERKINKTIKDLFPEESDPKEWTNEQLDLLFQHGSQSSVGHTVLERWVRSFHKNIRSNGWYIPKGESGDYYFIAPQPQITLSKEQEDLPEIVSKLKEYISTVIDLRGEYFPDSVIEIDIMEESLSAFGSYYIEYHLEDGTAELIKMRYHSPSTIKTGSLLEVLEYISKHHYYRT